MDIEDSFTKKHVEDKGDAKNGEAVEHPETKETEPVPVQKIFDEARIAGDRVKADALARWPNDEVRANKVELDTWYKILTDYLRSADKHFPMKGASSIDRKILEERNAWMFSLQEKIDMISHKKAVLEDKDTEEPT